MIDSSREISSKVRVVYFSSVTENTKRFVEKVGCESERIPVYPSDPPLKVDYEYVLITPTYGGGGAKGAVPKQVMKFLKDEENRALCRGVISAGNTNFGEGYCLAGKLIANKLSVPNLYRFELLGTPKEVSDVKNGLNIFWSNFVEKNKSAEYSNA